MAWRRYPPLSKKEISEVRKDLKKARFLIDESIDVKVADLLRTSGFNAKHVIEVGLAGHPDEDVLAYAYREDRVLLTHDPDFLDDRLFPPHRNPGVVVLPGSQGDRRALVTALNWVLPVIGGGRDLWRQSKVSVASDGTWSVATFERGSGTIVTTRYRFTKHDDLEVWSDDPLSRAT